MKKLPLIKDKSKKTVSKFLLGTMYTKIARDGKNDQLEFSLKITGMAVSFKYK